MDTSVVAQPVILNLGCGTRTSSACQNIDWSFYLRLRNNRVLRCLAPFFLKGQRRERFRDLDANLIAHDLRQGIPWPANSVTAVYLSHVFEHIDRDQAEGFLREILRVLQPGGVCRVVVPDLAAICRHYLADYDACARGEAPAGQHEATIEPLLEQSVRREAAGMKGQRGLRRFVERVVVGDARRRGETHQWMYDSVTLSHLMTTAGFSEVRVSDFQHSAIPGWADIRLDEEPDRSEYKPGSLYVEGIR